MAETVPSGPVAPRWEFEPPAGESWQTLYHRLWPLYKEAQAQVREYGDRIAVLEERLRDCVQRAQAGAAMEDWPWFDLYKER